MLTQVEKDGIKTVLLIEMGVFGELKCDGCRRKQELNCDLDQDVESVLFDPHIGEYNTCPVNFVVPSVNYFYRKLRYQERFTGSAPRFEDESPRFLEALDVYDAFRLELEQENAENNK